MHASDRRPCHPPPRRAAPRRQAASLPLLFTAAVAGAGCSGSAGAHSRMVAVHNAFEAVGINQVGRISEGSLAEGGAAQFPMDLEAQCYTFVAIGSDGARNVDVTVTDAAGARVASDSSGDTQATTQFCPSTRGRYTVNVRMASGGGSYILSSFRGGSRNASGGATAGGDGEAGSCGNPLPVQLGQTVTGDTSRGRSAHSGSCQQEGGREAPEVVYQLTLERRMQVTVQAEQEYDGVLFIRQGDCDEQGAEVPGACNDDAAPRDTTHSRIAQVLEPGTYFIFADGFDGEHGAFQLTVTGQDVPAPQEVCQSAANLPPGQAVSGQTSQDANIFGANCANGARGPDRVYRLEVPQESRVQLFQESDYDGVLYIRRACADPGSEVACNDDAEDTQHSRINTVLPPGTYYVFTDGFNPNSSGSYTLEADLAPVAGGGTPGDSCGDAQPLTPGTAVDGNTFNARDDIQIPCGATQEGFDVVYRLNVQNRSRVRLWFEQNGTDLGQNGAIMLARACAPGATPASASVACRAGAVGDDNALEAVVPPGQYYVVVDSAQARQFGRFRLNARVEDMTALERACRAAPVLRSGQTVTGTTSGDDRFGSSCAGGSRSPENLYRLVLRRRSFVRLALSSNTNNYDPSIYLRAACTDQGTERACNDDAPPGDTRHSLIETTLEPGTYTVFVDGFSNRNSGSYSMEVTINPQ